MITIQETLFQALRELGTEWITYQTSEIRNTLDQLNVLLNVNKLIIEGWVNAQDLKDEAPEFCFVYETVMLRDIQEKILHGNDH